MTTLLAIESSCDETAAAVLRDGRELVCSHVSSQIAIHAKTGGVIPEIAARAHVEAMPVVVGEALKSLSGGWDEIDAIAVTRGPGLVGCLLVGTAYAQMAAVARKVPVVGVSHLAGHVYSAWLSDTGLEPPYLALLVSGGHSECVLLREHGAAEELLATRDDAAGEAYDKVARLLGLPYPGGPVLDKLAREGDPARFSLPSTSLSDSLSFSGLKTAVRYLVRDLPVTAYLEDGSLDRQVQADIAAAFQARVIAQLTGALERAQERTRAQQIALVGGVAANSGLRAAVLERFSGLKVVIPPMALCTDNAAMIGAAGWNRIQTSGYDRDGFDADPGLRLFA